MIIGDPEGLILSDLQDCHERASRASSGHSLSSGVEPAIAPDILQVRVLSQHGLADELMQETVEYSRNSLIFWGHKHCRVICSHPIFNRS